jgi:hypothetical protein
MIDALLNNARDENILDVALNRLLHTDTLATCIVIHVSQVL